MRNTVMTTIATLAAGLLAFPATAAENDDIQHSAQEHATQAAMTIKGDFKFPETVIHDEKADFYLISNVNGELGARDDLGHDVLAPHGCADDFICRRILYPCTAFQFKSVTVFAIPFQRHVEQVITYQPAITDGAGRVVAFMHHPVGNREPRDG